MKRLLTSLTALAAVAALAAGPAAAHSPMTIHHSKMTRMHTCPAGQHWVKSYMKAGKRVHGYCRK